MGLAIGALCVLLFFGIANPTLGTDIWVAFAFWFVGFGIPITSGLVAKSKSLNLVRIIEIFIVAGLIVGAFFGMNVAYSLTMPQETWLSADKLLVAAVGICEELFFGVFILTALINWLHTPKFLAVCISAVAHSLFHIPAWGSDPRIMILFGGCFVVSRSIFVYLYPKVGVILAAHGGWNWLVT